MAFSLDFFITVKKQKEILEDEIYLPDHERFYRRREVDTRKLNFEYYWIDIKDAARKGAQGAPLRQRGLTDRSVFIERNVVKGFFMDLHGRLGNTVHCGKNNGELQYFVKINKILVARQAENFI